MKNIGNNFQKISEVINVTQNSEFDKPDLQVGDQGLNLLARQLAGQPKKQIYFS